MAYRLALSTATWICCVVIAAQADRQEQPTPRAAPRAIDMSPSSSPANPEMSVDVAIRTAIETLDQLEAGAKEAAFNALSDQISRHIASIEAQAPGSPWLDYLYGRAYALTGRRADAVERLRRFVETREGRNEWRAYLTLGNLFAEEFPQLARANYQRAAALNSGEPAVLFGLSRCASKTGDKDGAVGLARQAAVADGRKTIRYVAHLATVLKDTGRWNEAREEAEIALGLGRELMREQPGLRVPIVVVDAQYKLLIEIMRGRMSEAGRKAASDYLRLASYIRERGRITQMLVDHDVLRAIESGVNETAPDTPPALLEQLGVILNEVGKTEEAISVFERLLEVDPNNAVAAEWLRRLRPETTDEGERDQPLQP